MNIYFWYISLKFVCIPFLDLYVRLNSPYVYVLFFRRQNNPQLTPSPIRCNVKPLHWCQSIRAWWDHEERQGHRQRGRMKHYRKANKDSALGDPVDSIWFRVTWSHVMFCCLAMGYVFCCIISSMPDERYCNLYWTT